eukprot:748110-Prorocentrum_minimum.AAC.1
MTVTSPPVQSAGASGSGLLKASFAQAVQRNPPGTRVPGGGFRWTAWAKVGFNKPLPLAPADCTGGDVT